MHVLLFTYGEEFEPQLEYHHFQWNFIFKEYSFQEMKTETQREGEEWRPEKYLNGRIICKPLMLSLVAHLPVQKHTVHRKQQGIQSLGSIWVPL